MRFSLFAAVAGLAASVSASPIDTTAVSTSVVEARQAPAPGTLIYSCKKAGTIALTFDDGPFQHTAKALDLLKAAGFKATFFLNGANWGSIRDYEPVVKRMIAEGHQVGSHTWSHRDFTTIDATYTRWQMTKMEDELLRIIGRRPTYMRPPYFATNDQSNRVMRELGYQVVIADIDTNDWQNAPATSYRDFVTGLNNKGSIVLAHDVHASTVDTLLPQMIAEVKRRGLKAVPVGECLGDPSGNWYKTGPR